MNNESHGSSKSTGGPNGSGGSRFEREETFSPSGPVRAKIATRSGDVMVRTGESNELVVTLRASSPKFADLLDLAAIHFDAATNQLEIRSQQQNSGGSRARRVSRVSWFDFGGTDLDVSVVLPQGSSLEVATVSGNASLHGPLANVTVASVSGDVDAPDSADSIDVRTASGDVTTGNVVKSLKCRSASGDVVCRSAATKTEIMSASGDVVLTAERPGEIVVKAVSGDVIVHVARGLVVDISGNTVSGDMGTNIELDAPGEVGGDEEVIYVKVNTVSGDIRIDKAS